MSSSYPSTCFGEKMTEWSLCSWSHILHEVRNAAPGASILQYGRTVCVYKAVLYLGPSVSIISCYCVIMELCKFQGVSRCTSL